MRELTINPIDSQAVWDSFMASSKFSYYTQSWNYGEYLKDVRSSNIERIGYFSGEELVGVNLVTLVDSRFGNYVESLRGPVIDWDDVELVEAVLSATRSYYKDKDVFQLRIDINRNVSETKVTEVFSKLGFKNAVKSLLVMNPWMVEIEGRNDDELFEWMKTHEMRQKVPNYIRGAVRKGVRIERVENPEDFAVFSDMFTSMSDRKGFSLGDADMLMKMWEYMGEDLVVLIGYFNNRPVVSGFFVMYGNESSYLFGASTSEIGNSNAAYLLQWEAMKIARERGLSRHCLWGVVVGDSYQPGKPAYGYSYFKRSFGGYIDKILPPQEYPYSKIRYMLYSAVEKRRLKKAKRLGFL